MSQGTSSCFGRNQQMDESNWWPFWHNTEWKYNKSIHSYLSWACTIDRGSQANDKGLSGSKNMPPWAVTGFSEKTNRECSKACQHHKNPETGSSPPVKYFTDRSKVVLILWIVFVFSALCLLCLCARLFIGALWPPAGKGLTSWLSFLVYNCEFVTFPLVSWVRCGTWIYRFLIFAPLLTFINSFSDQESDIINLVAKAVMPEKIKHDISKTLGLLSWKPLFKSVSEDLGTNAKGLVSNLVCLFRKSNIRESY